ncbi:MAG TPA: WecB/TagA/CpsF family glycosyltransferase [Acetobacteraceae bacterium]|jgi:N-acetylglucosaminyldiphosphoundecaprenol N-acetyl-beta-D-mannosaminyltransferase|nr:WecB/TagA/CpsF family glycosyltransferase [Acetobacteraceae bacterium]
MRAPHPFRLLGLDFPDLTLEGAARWIESRPDGAPFGYVVTPNADHFVRLRRDPALTAIYRSALLRLLDSRVVAKAAHGLGLPAPPVVTGSDLTARLLANLPRHTPITIIGLRPEHVPALRARFGLAAVAHHNPPPDFERTPSAMRNAVRFVLDHPARLVFLALGSPRQEWLAAAIRADGGASGTGLCIGAGLDFLTGAARRAPDWMQRAGLEWLHRLSSDPARLARRYLRDDPPIFAMLLRERMRATTLPPVIARPLPQPSPARGGGFLPSPPPLAGSGRGEGALATQELETLV